MPVFVACHTFGWTVAMVDSFTAHFPKMRLLAIDNNPYKHQKVQSLFYHKNDGSWNKLCDAEREFINTHPQIDVLPIYKTDPVIHALPYHGEALDHAVRWLKNNKIDVMVILEPDCFIAGRKWMKQLLEPIAQGYWMSHGTKTPTNRSYPCGSAWLVDKIQCSMDPFIWKDKISCEEVYKIVNYPQHIRDIHKDPMYYSKPSPKVELFNAYGWDTSQRCWFEMAIQGKAKYVGGEEPLPTSVNPVGRLIDLHHHWGGSKIKRYPDRDIFKLI